VADAADLRVWTSQQTGQPIDTVALFNLSDQPLAVYRAWSNLGLSKGAFAARNLWTGARTAADARARVTIAPHDVVLLRVSR